jgi:hypothetical protein
MTVKDWLIGVRERATLFVILNEVKNLIFLFSKNQKGNPLLLKMTIKNKGDE